MQKVWFFGLLALVLFVGLTVHLAPLQPGIVSLQLAFTPQAFGAIVHAWPPEHLARYRAHLPVDGLLLVSYAAFGQQFARHAPLFARASLRLRRAAAWCLPLAAVFDAAENGLHAWLTAAPRFDAAGAYLASALCASLKWALMLAFAALVLRAWGCSGADDGA
jgi:hypothetical protein